MLPYLDRNDAERHLGNAIEAGTATCGVIGLGFIGSIVMRALLEAGIEAYGIDRSPAAVEAFSGGAHDMRTSNRWAVSSNPELVRDVDVVILAVRLLVQEDGSVVSEPLDSALRLLASHNRPARLVLLESTVPPGTTRRVAHELQAALSETAEVFVAHTPERLQVGSSPWTMRKIPHLVGGVDESATRLASQFLARVCDQVVPVRGPEISELSKLLENAFLTVGIALVAEVTSIAHAMGLSAADVTDAAATKPFGYFPFHPGPGVGGHCLPNDLKLLSRAGAEAGVPGELVNAASIVTARMPSELVRFTEDLLERRGIAIRGARIVLVGVGFKIGSSDTTESPAIGVTRELRRLAAVPVMLDTRVREFVVDGVPLEKVVAHSLPDTRAEAVIVLAGDPNIAGAVLSRLSEVVIDAGGGKALQGELPNAHRI